MKLADSKSEFFIACIINIMFILCCTSASNAQNRIAQSLNGTTYKIQIVDLSNPSDIKTDLIGFADKLFYSENSVQNGFTKTSFVEKQGGNSISFEAVCSAEKQGVMTWAGSVHENKIDGRIIWMKDGQDPIKYSFKGEAVAVENSSVK